MRKRIPNRKTITNAGMATGAIAATLVLVAVGGGHLFSLQRDLDANSGCSTHPFSDTELAVSIGAPGTYTLMAEFDNRVLTWEIVVH